MLRKYLNLFTFLALGAVLNGCSPDSEERVLAPIEVDGFQVTLETYLTIDQGQHNLDVHEILELLPVFEMPQPEANFLVKLDVTDNNADHDELAIPMPEKDELVANQLENTVTFGTLTFDQAGVFTYQIVATLEEYEDRNWVVDPSESYIVITIIEDDERESLVADVTTVEEVSFAFEYIYSIEDEITQAQEAIEQAQPAQDFTELQTTDEPQATDESQATDELQATDEPQATDKPQATDDTQTMPPSDIPEDDAITISNDEALSYQALVNRHFRLSSDFSPRDLTTVNVSSIGGTHMLRSAAASAAEELFQTAYSEGGYVLVATSGYRSYSEQLATHNHWISMMGETEARRISAKAGHSEHQLGLALDITTHSLGDLSEAFSTTEEGQWVSHNAHRFGFIIRYPQHREADTGYLYEPWHIRYVGVEAATAIYNNNQILEEYLGHS